jgi:hypothetical protein
MHVKPLASKDYASARNVRVQPPAIALRTKVHASWTRHMLLCLRIAMRRFVTHLCKCLVANMHDAPFFISSVSHAFAHNARVQLPAFALHTHA